MYVYMYIYVCIYVCVSVCVSVMRSPRWRSTCARSAAAWWRRLPSPSRRKEAMHSGTYIHACTPTQEYDGDTRWRFNVCGERALAAVFIPPPTVISIFIVIFSIIVAVAVYAHYTRPSDWPTEQPSNLTYLPTPYQRTSNFAVYFCYYPSLSPSLSSSSCPDLSR